jgi:AICAR transformylase/IMP cyclohydrolase PurH
VQAELQAGGMADATRFDLAVARPSTRITAQYDAAIANWLTAWAPTDGQPAEYPAPSNGFVKVQDLRYGENSAPERRPLPRPAPRARRLVTARQLQGKELSATTISPTPTLPGSA